MTDKQPEALQYAGRDHMTLGDYYLRHVSAMTGEALHAKSAIAAELAHRDREIDRLHAENETLRTGYEAARLEIESLRASHGQAPADAKALAEADRRAGEAERLLATYKEDVMRFEQVRSRMKYQWGADQRVSFDEVWDEALALKKAAQAAPTTQPAPAAVAGPSEFPHEKMDAVALGRYKAVSSDQSMFYRFAVVAGDGAQQLYIGREVDCLNMARKFAGAFLDGAFAYHSMTAAPTTQPAPQQEAPADELEEVLRERDDAEDFINELLDEVLGADRPEWSSAYNRYDAMNDVQERITALHKPAADKAWGRFESAMAEPKPSPAAQGDAQDAARYRLVRRGQHWSVIDGIGNALRAEELDAAVDAARAAQEGK